ncbi:MAG: CoA-binding protein [Candidatus Tectomicrobia bacterium]|uniref:CoA-binding protein n=1 Tax=Tectimicrobiota bacterium TaxID=2528274 RepID=A0A933GM30_UNCTE|nr:CoA-binding protein [Candidatus Tectomicrobia bacterium]
MNWENLDRAFNPKTVAVVGAKKLNDYMWLRAVQPLNGKVYSVNIDKSEIPGIEALGFKNYLSLMDIPEPVDYVICSVPREISPLIVRDCIKKQVGGVTLFTSGFAETGTPEGIKLQKQILEMAKEADLNLIGPNCMGIFNPRVGLRNFPNLYAGEGGPFGVISQSGTHCINISVLANIHGLKVSKAVSYGNAIILDSCDYLEYLLNDQQTEIIGMYIEGIRKGPRFLEILREAAAKKPVIIWKGGQTEAGTRATSSHTGSMAESMVIWESLIKQVGAIRVDNLEEMVDVAKGFACTKPISGKRVGLLSMTGGQSVVITDAFARAGFEVPLLTDVTYNKLASFFNIVGGSYKNPIDMGSNWTAGPEALHILDLLEEDANIDNIVLEFNTNFLKRHFGSQPEFYNRLFEIIFEFKEKTRKPFLVVTPASFQDGELDEVRNSLLKGGLVSYPSFDRGANALRKMSECHVQGR